MCFPVWLRCWRVWEPLIWTTRVFIFRIQLDGLLCESHLEHYRKMFCKGLEKIKWSNLTTQKTTLAFFSSMLPIWVVVSYLRDFTAIFFSFCGPLIQMKNLWPYLQFIQNVFTTLHYFYILLCYNIITNCIYLSFFATFEEKILSTFRNMGTT